MKIKWGALVVAGRGKIGGHVGSRNSAGDYLRTKVTPVNPNTSAQSVVRNRLAVISQAWRGLTEAQRVSFNAAVSDFAKTDIFGDLKNPTGFNLFQRLNNNKSIVGAGPLVIAPRPQAVLVETLGAIAYDSGVGASLTVALSDEVPADTSIEIWATPGLSPGKSFVKSEYRLILVAGATTPTPIDIITPYTAKFGTQAEGTKVFVQIKFINNTTGQASTTQSTSTIVVST